MSGAYVSLKLLRVLAMHLFQLHAKNFDTCVIIFQCAFQNIFCELKIKKKLMQVIEIKQIFFN